MDPVFYTHFKANKKRLCEYPNLFNYVKDVYQYPGVAETVHIDHIKTHFYWTQIRMNPTRIVAAGPVTNMDYSEPHDRDRFSQ
jgi:putative glutathione S-transferase